MQQHSARLSTGRCLAPLKLNGRYEGACNIFIVDMFSSPNKMAPVAKHKVQRLVDHFFDKPFGDYPFDIHVCLKTGQDPTQHFGALVVLSPPELIWSCILGLGNLLDASISDAEASRKQQAMQATF